MKRIFFILITLLAFVAVTNAQTQYTFTGSDTITNTATVNIDLTVKGSYDSGVFQVINTKLSGTAAGKTYFKGSVDGTNYVTLDSLTNTNQTTNTKVFSQTPPIYPYYRLSSTGSGTMSVITAGKAHFKKK